MSSGVARSSIKMSNASLLKNVAGTEDPASPIEHAAQNEHALSIREAAKRYKKAIMWTLVVSLGISECSKNRITLRPSRLTLIVMESYDTLLLGSFYAYPSFQQHFGEKVGEVYAIPANWQLGLVRAKVTRSDYSS